jgi:signal transduction histidine kinase
MRFHQRMTGHRLPRHLPQRTIRMRLTLIHWGLFVASGAVLLAITVALSVALSNVGSSGSRGRQGAASLPSGTAGQHSPGHQLLIVSAIALAIMAIPAISVGWLMAGRYLRPLRKITAAARTISATSLHERLNLAGPQDELKELGDTFDDLLGRLERSFQAQRQFAANAAHELRTPHATMRVWLDVALDKPGPLPRHIIDLGDRLRHELDHVDRLLDSLLVLARAQHGAITDEAALPLDGLVSGAVDALASTISGMSLDVSQRRCPSAQVTGSKTLLARMIQNVVDNAVRHNSEGGWVRIRTDVAGANARLVVENGGTVLGEQDVQHLTQPFRRLGAERTESDTGTGLGLSIVASIAEIHGGRLELHARQQGGLQVIIGLPLAVRIMAQAPA